MTLPNSLRTGPDEHGRFGIHGGRFVAETLMPLILELEQAYEAAKRDPAFDAELRGLVQGLCRPAVAALLRRAADRASRRGQDLLQARRAQPHRRAQDQQRARPDHAGAADGQEADHRRDRRRPARRRDRDRGRPVRPGMHRLHGRARHRAAAAERVPHAPAGRRGPAGELGLAHAEGRAERGAARLGQQSARHLLRHRHGRGPASLPGHGARLPVGDRHRGAGADPGQGRPAAGRAGGGRRRRLERHGPVPPVPRRPRRADRRGRGRRATASPAASTRRR